LIFKNVSFVTFACIRPPCSSKYFCTNLDMLFFKFLLMKYKNGLATVALVVGQKRPIITLIIQNLDAYISTANPQQTQNM